MISYNTWGPGGPWGALRKNKKKMKKTKWSRNGQKRVVMTKILDEILCLELIKKLESTKHIRI